MRIAIFFAVTTLMVTTLSSCRPDMAEFSALKERVAALEGQTRAMEGHSEVIKTSKVGLKQILKFQICFNEFAF